MIMEIVLSSRNKKKISELRALFYSAELDITLLSLDDIGVYDDTEENGLTFEENSLIKAAVPASLGYIGIADDSGLCVDALNGKPGIYSARFSGEDADDLSNNAKLISELDGVPYEKRSAKFVCVVSCVVPSSLQDLLKIPEELDVSESYNTILRSSKAFCVRGECNGLILDSPRGENGFGYDPLFYIPEKQKTFAELSSQEKSAMSHRGNAMRAFVCILKELTKG